MTTWQTVPLDLSPDKTVAWTHFADLSYGDFGRSERLNHWRLTKIMEAGRLFSLRAGLMDYPSIVNEKFTTFELGSVLTADPALWSVPQRATFPYKVSLELESLGKTSATLYSRLVNKLDNKTLATWRGKIVYVDFSSRRPAPLPDWLLQQYSPKVQKNPKPFALPKDVPQVPATAFHYNVVVPPDDLDHNKHNNQSSYLRYCCDAAQLAVTAGRLSTFSTDISYYPLQEYVAVFTGESGAGDSLWVSLWQQDDQPSLVRCVITREDGKQRPVIFHGSVTYGLTPVKTSRL